MNGPAVNDLTRLASGDSRVRAIADTIARSIIEGQLRPGHELSSVELAKQFGTSRTPVREALVMLAGHGLIAIEPRRTPRVAPVRLSDVRDLYQVRASLYALAAELIVERATAEQRAELWRSYDELAAAHAARDVDGYFWANVRFRDTEIEIAGNHQLSRQLDALRLRTHQLRHFSLSLPRRLDRSLTGHELLLRAYDDGDAALAVSTTRWVVLSALRAIEAAWERFGPIGA